MKKILFFGMVLTVFLMVLFTILANTPAVVEKLTQDWLKSHKIVYENITGDLLEGVNIKQITYDNKPLATNLNVRWSPLSLLEKKIVLHSVSISDLNITNLTALIESFESDDNTTKEKIDFSLIIQKGSVTTTPYAYKHYRFNRMEAKMDEIFFDINKNSFKKGDIEFKTDLNYGKVNLKAQAIGGMDFKGSGDLTVNQMYYDRYHIPIDAKQVNYAVIDDFNVSKHGLTVLARTKGNKIFKDMNSTNNLDVISLNSEVFYSSKTENTTITSNAVAKSHYAPRILLTSKVFVDKDQNTTYQGTANAKNMTNLHPKLLQVLTDTKVIYKGDENSFDAAINTKDFKGSFKSDGFKGGMLNAESKKQMLIKEWLELPKTIENTKGIASIKAPVSFKSPFFTTFDAELKSDLIDAAGKIVNDKTVWTIDVLANVPSNSTLRKLYPSIKWDALAGSKVKIGVEKDSTNIDIGANELSTRLRYANTPKTLDGTISIGGLQGTISGSTTGILKIRSNTSSIENALAALNKFVNFTPPPLRGDLDVDASIDNLTKGEISLISSSIYFGEASRDQKPIEKLNAKLSFTEAGLSISNYNFVYDKIKYFSTKQSVVNIDKETLKVGSLWVNDQAKVDGTYNIVTRKGNFNIIANNLLISHEAATVKLDASLLASVDNDNINLKGNIVVLDGDILYYFGQKTFPSDDDIIIIQDLKQKTSSSFVKNLSLSIKVISKASLRYKQSDSSFNAKLDLSLEKLQGEPLMVFGLVTIPKGGYYIFGGKRFNTETSYIYFIGDANRPQLDLQATYRAPNHTIRVNIAGTPGNPLVNFSSTPKLTREQILALIMFDSEMESGKYTEEEMMKMMGGIMAKSILSDIGLQVDHLVFGADNSVEVGKKIGKRLTLIYANDDVSKAKLKYEFTSNIEGVMTVSQESNSADIVYKKEFKNFKQLFGKEDNNASR
ncbi:MAG: translocation/assembly module TamB domain-containing protein [Sulfurovaceae bacterium]|nr:translocation/assembly module TamB domain-containing protein [Sulfurovaceae bacterium]